jgi:hypothetical protein
MLRSSISISSFENDDDFLECMPQRFVVQKNFPYFIFQQGLQQWQHQMTIV